jgi:nucleolar protein 14
VQGGGGGGGGDDLEDDFGGGGEEAAPLEGGPAGGYALRRAKRAKKEAEREARAAKAQRGSGSEGSGSDEGSDDDGEEGSSEEEGGSSEEEGAPGLEARRQAAAAGSHPLQQAFRDASARLMSKFNVKPAAAPAGGGSGDSSSDEEEEEGSGPTSDSGESGSDEEDGAAPSGSDSEGEPAGEPEPETRGGGEGAAGRDFSDPGVGALSFTPPLPETYPQFAAMASGLGPQQLSELLRRVRAFHAPALNSGGRKKLQALYGVVAQHFSTLAAARPPALAHLDTLVPHLLELTPVVPFYAATLARARLVRAQAALAQRLRDPLLRAAAWPPARTLLLLKLLATLFPASDRRHPVLTPASLLACAALAQCPLARPRDVGAGLYLASLAMHLHSQARRFVSEPLAFAAAALRLALPARPGDAEAGPRWLCVAGGGPAEALPAAEGDIEPLAVLRVLGEEDDAYFSSPAFKTAAAAAAARLVRRAAHVYADVDALPEILAPAQEALRAIVAAANGGSSKAPKPKAKSRGGAAPAGALVAPGLASLCGAVLAEADAAVAAAAARRRPLCLPSMVALPESRQFNPRFEEGYAAGKDYDPDRDRADRRRLQREVRREERGAMRELRKDTAFMAGVRDRERAGAGAERDKSARRAMAFLQQQEADFKSGGQGGMWKKRSRK